MIFTSLPPASLPRVLQVIASVVSTANLGDQSPSASSVHSCPSATVSATGVISALSAAGPCDRGVCASAAGAAAEGFLPRGGRSGGPPFSLGGPPGAGAGAGAPAPAAAGLGMSCPCGPTSAGGGPRLPRFGVVPRT
jgi:hypothetical protein